MKVIFHIRSENFSTKILFNDEFSIDKIEDTVEENNYIKNVKSNFAERAVEKLISSIRQKK